MVIPKRAIQVTRSSFPIGPVSLDRLTNHDIGCVNLSFAYVEGESLLMALKDIALSSGSACTSASLEPSYVLRALGADDEMAHSSIRFGIGRFTTEEEIDFVINKVSQHVQKLRDMSPLWEMASSIERFTLIVY